MGFRPLFAPIATAQLRAGFVERFARNRQLAPGRRAAPLQFVVSGGNGEQ